MIWIYNLQNLLKNNKLLILLVYMYIYILIYMYNIHMYMYIVYIHILIKCVLLQIILFIKMNIYK